MKDNLLVSFSGGETSALMTLFVWGNWKDKYNIEVVFANTGEENEETLIFVDRFSKYFKIPVTWIESKVHHGIRKSSTFTIVNFETASRKGEPFEEMIKKYGIPNKPFPHCTRELKLRPIKSFVKSLGWVEYYTAIGIRADEFDRVNADHKKLKILYPLIKDIPRTKKNVNYFWSLQPFRLNLKGYEGNCKTCWKKSEPKLLQIAINDPKSFDFMKRMEHEYGDYTPPGRKKITEGPQRFFRGNKSAQDILEKSKTFTGVIIDDNLPEESCDIYSNCK